MATRVAQGIGLNVDTQAVPKYQDLIFNINFANSKRLKHTIDVGRNSYIRSVLSYSYTSNSGDIYKYYDSLPERQYITRQETKNTGLRLTTYINSKLSTRFTMRGGFLAEQNGLNTFSETREGRPGWEVLRDYNAASWLLQPYVQGKYPFTEKRCKIQRQRWHRAQFHFQ